MLGNVVKVLIKRFIKKETLYWALSKIRMGTRKSLRFEVYLVYHCNLNCAGCAVFSPLAKEEYLDTASYEQDCKRLSRLTNGEAECIRLLGGEPTLHKSLLDFCNITRKYFKQAKIQLVTNGILLPKMEDIFWETCGRNNITIQISRYPLKINMDEIIEKAGLYNVFMEITESKTDEMFHLKLDTDGKQAAKHSFKNCWVKNSCITLSHGKLYTCSIIPAVEHFNRYFNRGLVSKESDYIDIYRAESIEEILNFLCKPVSFCRYCDIKGMSYGHKWQISKKDIGEWI
jgi:MoaA/NifB/PqqE/SkfB family radical SAM enzyme